MREAVSSGLDRVGKLAPGSGFLDVTAGLRKDWQGGLDAFVRGEVGVKARENVDLFGFASGDRVGLQAGVGARVRF